MVSRKDLEKLLENAQAAEDAGNRDQAAKMMAIYTMVTTTDESAAEPE